MFYERCIEISYLFQNDGIQNEVTEPKRAAMVSTLDMALFQHRLP